MDKKLESILEDIEENCFDYEGFIKDEKRLVEILKQYAKDYALSLLPEERSDCGSNSESETIYYEFGFNSCLKEIKDKI